VFRYPPSVRLVKVIFSESLEETTKIAAEMKKNPLPSTRPAWTAHRLASKRKTGRTLHPSSPLSSGNHGTSPCPCPPSLGWKSGHRP
jgi:hypothetical protein